jgi:hypothetical protein
METTFLPAKREATRVDFGIWVTRIQYRQSCVAQILNLHQGDCPGKVLIRDPQTV